jgi:hypothetical protein
MQSCKNLPGDNVLAGLDRDGFNPVARLIPIYRSTRNV